MPSNCTTNSSPFPPETREFQFDEKWAFVERHNGTGRNRNARKVRKTYCFSKDWQVDQAVTYFTMYSYNFCWPV